MTLKDILYIVFPALGNKAINNTLRKKIENNREIDEEKLQTPLSTAENPDAITVEKLKKQYDDALKTKDKFEDKAKTTIVCVTISVSLIMGASGMLNSVSSRFDSPLVQWVSYALFVYAVVSMITAAVLAIKVLVDENKIFVVSADCPIEDERDTYDKCIGQNVTQNYIRNNHIFTAYECIRNSLVSLFIIMAIAVIPIKPSSTNRGTATDSHRGFSYDESVIDMLSKYDVDMIKTIVEDALPEMQIKEGETYSIVNRKNSLFIRFQVINNNISIMGIEEISFEQ